MRAWVEAGIFPQFAVGNDGPTCGRADNPGNLPESYAAGAFDMNGNLYVRSGRGPSAWGQDIIKPNITAPGVNVRCSVPGGGYASFTGTSMASPHVAGTVALMWSGAPVLERDIDATRLLLDETAADTEDLSCGGTPENNNVWGQGKLDAFAAVDHARSGTGALTGTVTDAVTGEPIPGATVSVTGPVDRERRTGEDGTYQIGLRVGQYDVTVSAFGYTGQTAQVVIVDGQATVRDFALDRLTRHAVSGTVVYAHGVPAVGVTVSILSTPVPPATTDANGSYRFADVPEGTYQVRVSSGRCFEPATRDLVVAGDTTLDVTVTTPDAFGYICRVVDQAFEEADTVLNLTGDDEALSVDLPFPFDFYGESYDRLHVCINGFVEFSGPAVATCPFQNSAIPSTQRPNGAVYPFWDDLLVVDAPASVRADLRGEAPDRRFVIEFRNMQMIGGTPRQVDFNVVLYENGEVLTQYRNLAREEVEQGGRATVGIEDPTGTSALQYSSSEPALTSGLSILYVPPPSGLLAGTVTDANTGGRVAGATIEVFDNGTVVRTAQTRADGSYRLRAPLGTHVVTASAPNYATASTEVTFDTDGQAVVADFTLAAGMLAVEPGAVEANLRLDGGTATRTFTVTNEGTASASVTLGEVDDGFEILGSQISIDPTTGADVPWVSVEPQELTLAPGESATVTVVMDSGAVEQPGTHTAQVTVGHDTPYQVDPVDVTLVVTPPPDWGMLSGTVTGTDCDGSIRPLAGAMVELSSRWGSVTLVTDDDGRYAWWMPARSNPVRVAVTATGFVGQSRMAIVVPQQEGVHDFTLMALC